MNKKGITQFQRINIGMILSIVGIIFMSFNAMIGNIFMTRVGIGITTIGAWLISWN